ncbi:CBL-interacting protein kinase 10 [Halotydeus destructor]|nr:CBL-interacting protein kinase 10 [Halotydeus destructor]
MDQLNDGKTKPIGGKIEPPKAVENRSPTEDDKLISPNTQKSRKDLPSDVYETGNGRTVANILSYKGYVLGKFLGKGGFGTVYESSFSAKQRKAEGSCPDSSVACKVITLRKKNSKKQLDELKNELDVLEKLPHVNIIKLYEHFIIDDKVYIFMELAKGGTLYHYVSGRGPFSEDISRMFFKQMCSAVSFMHSKGYSHRDLKLLNVLLIDSRKRDLCKVTDFGLSRDHFCIKNGVLMCDSYCGTPLYMAPEVHAIKKSRVGGQPVEPYSPFGADIWALGVCLYALLNKHWPFNDEDDDMYERMMNKNWRLTRRIAKTTTMELQNLLHNMLEPDPVKRITFAGIYAHKWFKIESSN